jgi:hypothetical protein
MSSDVHEIVPRKRSISMLGVAHDETYKTIQMGNLSARHHNEKGSTISARLLATSDT